MNAKEDYQNYLAGKHWQEISKKVKQRAGYRCQVCDSPLDLQAHHRRYDNRGRESLDDLICLCRRCHGVFHGLVPHYAPDAPPKAERKADRPHKKEQIRLALEAADKEPKTYCTNENFGRLRMSLASYHWMIREGVNPKKSQWRKRMIYKNVPASFFK